MHTPKEIALMAAKALDNKKGLDIQLLQVEDNTRSSVTSSSVPPPLPPTSRPSATKLSTI